MINNHEDEFILAPPSMLANTVERRPPRGRNGLAMEGKKNTVEFKILQPNYSVYSAELPADSNGYDCINIVSSLKF